MPLPFPCVILMICGTKSHWKFIAWPLTDGHWNCHPTDIRHGINWLRVPKPSPSISDTTKRPGISLLVLVLSMSTLLSNSNHFTITTKTVMATPRNSTGGFQESDSMCTTGITVCIDLTPTFGRNWKSGAWHLLCQRLGGPRRCGTVIRLTP